MSIESFTAMLRVIVIGVSEITIGTVSMIRESLVMSLAIVLMTQPEESGCSELPPGNLAIARRNLYCGKRAMCAFWVNENRDLDKSPRIRAQELLPFFRSGPEDDIDQAAHDRGVPAFLEFHDKAQEVLTDLTE